MEDLNNIKVICPFALPAETMDCLRRKGSNGWRGISLLAYYYMVHLTGEEIDMHSAALELGWSDSKFEKVHQMLIDLDLLNEGVLDLNGNEKLDVLTGRVYVKRKIYKKKKIKRKTVNRKPDTGHNYVEFSREHLKAQKKNFPTRLARVTPTMIKQGAETIDKLCRLDGYNFEDQIKPAIEWGRGDQFWADKILSLRNMRKRSDSNGKIKFQNLLESWERDTGNTEEQEDKPVRLPGSIVPLRDALKKINSGLSRTDIQLLQKAATGYRGVWKTFPEKKEGKKFADTLFAMFSLGDRRVYISLNTAQMSKWEF